MTWTTWFLNFLNSNPGSCYIKWKYQKQQRIRWWSY